MLNKSIFNLVFLWQIWLKNDSEIHSTGHRFYLWSQWTSHWKVKLLTVSKNHLSDFGFTVSCTLQFTPEDQQHEDIARFLKHTLSQAHAFNLGFSGNMKSSGSDLANARFRIGPSCVPPRLTSRQSVKLYLLLLP